MPHKLWKISARFSKRCGVQLRKTHGGGGLHQPPLTGRGLNLISGKSSAVTHLMRHPTLRFIELSIILERKEVFTLGIVPHVFADIEAKKKKKHVLDRHAIFHYHTTGIM